MEKSSASLVHRTVFWALKPNWPPVATGSVVSTNNMRISQCVIFKHVHLNDSRRAHEPGLNLVLCALSEVIF